MKPITRLLILFAAGLISAAGTFAQVAINTDGSTYDESSMLDVKSIEKGMLVPRMTATQRDAISLPAKGLIIYCTTDDHFYYNQGKASTPDWVVLGSEWIKNGSSLYYTGGNVGIGESSPGFPLNFSSTLGDKISLYGLTGNHYGLGVQGGQLQIHSDNSASDVVFGYGSSSAFTERMRIKGNGQVAVGTATPAGSAALEVQSTGKGFLPPRMTSSQMYAITGSVPGLMVYNTTLNTMCWYDGTTWEMGTNEDGQSCGSVTYGSKTYNSVIIGAQCWMTGNLDIGTAILANYDQTNNAEIEKYCYDNNEANCTTYGGLYQWYEMMNYSSASTLNPSGVQGICPAGWHIPSPAEMEQMTDYLGGNDVAGGKMKEAGTTHWASPNTDATNSSGFTGLPGGYVYSGAFYSLNMQGNFCTTDGGYYYGYPICWTLYLVSSSGSAGYVATYDDVAMSVRCLKD